MGTSLASIQVYFGNGPKSETRLEVVEALREYVLKGPFTETAQDQDPDRTVVVGPTNAARWLTLLDSQGNLRELARHLSAILSRPTVFINLIDSDVIHIRLYRNGETDDDYCNAPHHYDDYGSPPDWDDLDETQLQALTRGDLSKWRDLFVEGPT